MAATRWTKRSTICVAAATQRPASSRGDAARCAGRIHGRREIDHRTEARAAIGAAIRRYRPAGDRATRCDRGDLADEGEAAFRRYETEAILRALAGDEPRIIAVGGGALTVEENRVRLAQRAWRVFIKISPDQAWRNSPRPRRASRARRGADVGRNHRALRCAAPRIRACGFYRGRESRSNSASSRRSRDGCVGCRRRRSKLAVCSAGRGGQRRPSDIRSSSAAT